MSVVPDKRLGKLQFFENHITPWTTNVTDIGLLVPEVADLAAKTLAARSAFNAKESTEQAARAATQAYYTAITQMNDAGSALMKKIRAKAEQVGGTSVYTLAEIPPPPTPAPVGPPGKPEKLKVALEENGIINLTWKCPNPAGAGGTFYQIWRAYSTDGPWQYIGTTGEKKWEDATVPAGSGTVVYQLQASRTTVAGPFALFVVKFGTTSGGQMYASVTEGTPAKLAA